MEKPQNIVGLDLSVNGWGAVQFDWSGRIRQMAILTDTKKWIKVLGKTCTCYLLNVGCLKKTKEDRELLVAARRRIVEHSIEALLGGMKPGATYVNIEHYSLHSKSRALYEIGEVGGIIRRWLFNNGFNLRQTDPQSQQMWALKGQCSKRLRFDLAVANGLLIDLKSVNAKPGKDYEGPGTDLADAFWLAHMLWVELKVRLGEMAMTDLDQRRRDVINRVTPSWPIGLLSRPFISMAAVRERLTK